LTEKEFIKAGYEVSLIYSLFTDALHSVCVKVDRAF